MSEHESYNADEANEFAESEDLSSDEPTQMPLGTGTFAAEEGDLDGLDDGLAKKRRSGPLILIAVVLLAIGGLFCMHALSKITGATQSDTEIEATITNFLDSMTGTEFGNSEWSAKDLVASHDKIVGVLSGDYSDMQIPLSDLQFNPFVIDRGTRKTAQPEVDYGDDDARRLERKRAKRREEIQSAARSLRLQSVIMGGMPLANISGSIVRIGDLVTVDHEEVDFLVTAITRDTATITVNDSHLTLKVEVVLELDQGR